LHSADLSGTATFDLGGGFSARTTLGGQYNRRVQLETLAFGEGLAPGSETVAGASLIRGGEQTLETIVAGGFVEQQVSFADRLFITLAGRVDGASSFGRDFDAAFYPKASLSWLAIGDAGEAQAFLSSLRLRTAYGLSGVQPDPLASLQRFELASALVDGAAVPGARLLTLGNPNLRPERQSELEAGVDIELDDGRIHVELTGYHRQSEGALVAVPFDPSFAIASQQQNVGAVRNRGVEGLLRARLVDQPSWGVEVNLNGSYNDNKLLKLAPGVASSGSLWRQVPGYPLFGFWARPVLSYDDANGNGIIEPAEVVVGDSEVFAGSSIPTRDLVAGTTVTLARGTISLSGLINYRGGYKTYNEAVWLACLAGASCRAMNDPATPLREQAYAVAYTTASLGNARWGLIEDASHWRLREVSFTYNASEFLARALGARTATLTLAGRNLALFTDYSGIDPEVSANVGTALQSGAPQYPLSTYWIARVNLGF
ncbi:MAG: TonB-dependent receptor domain-containing protein, partial [Vicinamibacteraceae bacterium]